MEPLREFNDHFVTELSGEGIAVVAGDLAAAVAHAPAAAFSPIRAAKQPGRWICTARHDVLELGLQVALMSPHVPPS